ncbi:cobalamin-dependent protein [Pseudotabrizicola alkalilacus]|nr:cobalamin-dependent protein [Pseudotabrizicola alkalilacus]
MKVLLASLSLEFPLAAYCLAAALRADPGLADCDTALHDIDWPRMSHYESKNAEIWRFLARLEAERLQVLGLSLYLWSHIALRELAGIVRRVFSHLTIVVGGPEVATPAAAETWLAAGEADIVVRGEGERVLAAVIRRMRDGAPLAGLPGTSMRIDGDMRHGPPMALRRLDDLPSPFLTGLVPAYWQSWFAMIRQRLADPATAEGRAWLDARSPLAHVAAIHCPVLMIHGRQDVRVPLLQARAMAAAGRPVTLAVLPDEGHFISEQANRVALAALVEAFLQDQAGGPVEDVAEDLVASRMAILLGGDFLPGPVLARLRERNASPA